MTSDRDPVTAANSHLKTGKSASPKADACLPRKTGPFYDERGAISSQRTRVSSLPVEQLLDLDRGHPVDV